jgi:hypothetical protein
VEKWVLGGGLGTGGCTVSTIVADLGVDLWGIGWRSWFGALLVRVRLTGVFRKARDEGRGTGDWGLGTGERQASSGMREEGLGLRQNLELV